MTRLVFGSEEAKEHAKKMRKLEKEQEEIDANSPIEKKCGLCQEIFTANFIPEYGCHEDYCSDDCQKEQSEIDNMIDAYISNQERMAEADAYKRMGETW